MTKAGKILSITIPIVLTLALLAYIGFREVKYAQNLDRLSSLVSNMTVTISEKDSTMLVYSSIIDNITTTKRSLEKQLEDMDTQYKGIIKGKDARILQLSEYTLSLKDQLATVDVDVITEGEVVNLFIEDFYPDPDDWFVQYNGQIMLDPSNLEQNPVIAREFSFTPMKVNIAVTENTDGSWEQYVEGPDWININPIVVNSLPPPQLQPERPRITWSVGAGVSTIYNDRSYLHVGVGANYKDWSLVGQASIGYAGVTVLRKFTR